MFRFLQQFCIYFAMFFRFIQKFAPEKKFFNFFQKKLLHFDHFCV